MWSELQKHRVAYSVLIAGLCILGLLIFAVWPNRELQRVGIAALAVFYFIWGVVTHVHSATVTRRVVIEYAGVAMLAGVILMVLTF